jgi:hypothetical protein
MGGGVRSGAMSMRSFVLLLSLLSVSVALAACAERNPELAGYPGLAFEIESFYETHAWERNATCLRPEMAIARIETLEDTPEKLVVKVRYHWEDKSFGRDEEMFPRRGGGGWCSDWGERVFTLAKRPDGRVSVVAMTGPQRERG